MLQLNFFGHDVELVKSNYQGNDRLAILLLDAKSKTLFGDLTVNLPEFNFITDFFGGSNNCEAFINHMDAIAPYSDILDWIHNTELIVHPRIGEGQSGFNHYIAVQFNEDIVDQMRDYNDLY